MNIKLKITFIIIITLVIGIVIGAMLNRTLTQNRVKRILSRRNPPVFISFYERIIEPDTNQREEIRKILDKHAKHLSEIRANFSEELQSSMESLRAELDPILTPEQKKRLEKGFPGRPPFPMRPPERIDVDEELSVLKERLSLSEDQASEIKQILEESRDKFKMMREKGVRWRERWQIMKELEEKKEKAIKNILTRDQKNSFEQIKKERHKKIEEEMSKRREIMKERDIPRY